MSVLAIRQSSPYNWLADCVLPPCFLPPTPPTPLQDCVKLPHLVVVPLTTLSNWERELTTWAPYLRVVSLHGSAPARQLLLEHCLFAPAEPGQGRGRAALQVSGSVCVCLCVCECEKVLLLGGWGEGGVHGF